MGSMRPTFQIGNVTWGGELPVFILGPCVLESEDFAWKMARALAEMTREIGVPFIFKASYDKANRTSVKSARGPGLEEGCKVLAEIGRELGVPVTTDVHSRSEERRVGKECRCRWAG